MKKNKLLNFPISGFLVICFLLLSGCEYSKVQVDSPESYSGTAERTEFSCFEDDCTRCSSAKDKISINIGTEGDATITTTGPCIRFGVECIYEEDSCAWSIHGSYDYHEDKSQMDFSFCNDDKYFATGGGSFSKGLSEGSVSCIARDTNEKQVEIVWKDVPIIK